MASALIRPELQGVAAPAPEATHPTSSWAHGLERLATLSALPRYRECLLLQGSPLLGVALTAPATGAAVTPVLPALLAGSFLLTLAVFLLNDVVDLPRDRQVVEKRRRVERLLRAGERSAGRTAVVCAALGLLSLLTVGPTVAALGLGVLLCGFLYSSPLWYGKAQPVWSSALHLLGGLLHFGVGAAAAGALAPATLLLALPFVAAFVAGHLIQEIRDYEADRLTGVATNAVRFGRPVVFQVGTAIFLLGYASLAGAAQLGLLPVTSLWLPLLAAVTGIHLWQAQRAWQAELTQSAALSYQASYRLCYVALGILLILSLAPLGSP